MPPGLLGEDFGKLTLTSKIFEEKTAREKPYQYDGNPEKNGPAWRSDTFDYFVSKCPAAGPWLAWAEAHGPMEITGTELVQAKMDNALMTDEFNPTVLSHHVWGFLQHCLSGTARQTFKATARQDGQRLEEVDAGDQLSDGLRPPRPPEQVSAGDTSFRPRDRVAGDRGLGDAVHGLMDAGGAEMNFEDRRGQMLRILPKDLRRDVFRRLTDFKSIPDLKEGIREQLELEKDWDATDRSAPRPRAVGVVDHGGDEPSAAVLGPTDEDMEALLSLTADSPPEEVLAVQKRFQKFNGSRP